ncbi:MAG: hypothetical protein IJI45_15140 [Anaerolineaceae bacterium]|nr:hypothetical protein [Anaerolineaceae bacterium]
MPYIQKDGKIASMAPISTSVEMRWNDEATGAAARSAVSPLPYGKAASIMI